MTTRARLRLVTRSETADEWWTATGHQQARAEYADFDVMRDFFHDVPPEIVAAAFAAPPPGGPSERLFAGPWPLDRWPSLPTRAAR